ncbi:hypothetical protein [Nocardia beijingensis]
MRLTYGPRSINFDMARKRRSGVDNPAIGRLAPECDADDTIIEPHPV